MVAPITGPFTTNWNYASWPNAPALPKLIWYKTTYRQKPPFNTPLQYSSRRAWTDRNHDSMPASAAGIPYSNTVAEGEARSKAWTRFVESIGERAELGTTFAEGREALGMVVARCAQLTKFLRHLNRFDFANARRVLDLPRSKSSDVWSKDRTIANNFLEVHFGWSPLISDIHSAMTVLTSPIKPVRARGRGSSQEVVLRYGGYPYPPMWQAGQEFRFKALVQYQADVEVSNPNVALANRLGLINPAQIVWELVPYSFVVDWFVNVGQTLGCWSDLLGYSVTNPTTTTRVFSSYRTKYTWTFPREEWGECVYMNRSLGLNRPYLFVRPLQRFSVTRGITAISLLIQQLPKRPADLATPSLKKRRIYRWSDYEHEIG